MSFLNQQKNRPYNRVNLLSVEAGAKRERGMVGSLKSTMTLSLQCLFLSYDDLLPEQVTMDVRSCVALRCGGGGVALISPFPR